MNQLFNKSFLTKHKINRYLTEKLLESKINISEFENLSSITLKNYNNVIKLKLIEPSLIETVVETVDYPFKHCLIWYSYSSLIEHFLGRKLWNLESHLKTIKIY